MTDDPDRTTIALMLVTAAAVATAGTLVAADYSSQLPTTDRERGQLACETAVGADATYLPEYDRDRALDCLAPNGTVVKDVDPYGPQWPLEHAAVVVVGAVGVLAGNYWGADDDQ